jgi:tetratricopeptide (TPR) repeat protein
MGASTLVIVLCGATLTGPNPHTLFSAGVAAFDAGDMERARTLFGEVRAVAPQWGMVQLYWAMAESALNPNSTEAVAALEAAAAAVPDNPRASYYLGVAYGRNQRFAEAERALRRVQELRPGFRDSDFQLASILDQSGQVEPAIAAFEQVLRVDPTHLGALSSLASLYERAGRLPDAETVLLRVIKQQPQNAYHRYQLAQFYERIGDPKKAARAQKDADELDPRPERRMRPLPKSGR